MSHVLIDSIAEALRLQGAGGKREVPGLEASGVVGRLLRRRAEASGLDVLQMDALLQLRAAHAPRLSILELGGTLAPGADVVAVVSGLVRAGLVESEGPTEVGLSARGRQLADQVLSELGVLLAYGLGPLGLTPGQFAVRVRKELL